MKLRETEGGNIKKYNPAIHHRRSIRLKGYDYTNPGAYFVTICLQEKDVHLLGKVVAGQIQLSHFGEIVLKCWHRLSRHYPNVIVDEFMVMPNHVHGIILIGANIVGAGNVGVGANIVGAGLQNRNIIDVKPARTMMDDANIGHQVNGGYVGAGLQYGNVIDVKPARTMMDDVNIAHPMNGGNMANGGEIIYPLSEIIRGFKTFSARRINELRGIAGVPVWQRNYWEHIVRNKEEMQRIREYIVNNPLRWEMDKLNPVGRKIAGKKR
jgi:putative transposase